MIDSDADGTTTRAHGLTQTDRALRERVRGEYLEMPGLRLTLEQAARLFDLELSAVLAGSPDARDGRDVMDERSRVSC